MFEAISLACRPHRAHYAFLKHQRYFTGQTNVHWTNASGLYRWRYARHIQCIHVLCTNRYWQPHWQQWKRNGPGHIPFLNGRCRILFHVGIRFHIGDNHGWNQQRRSNSRYIHERSGYPRRNLCIQYCICHPTTQSVSDANTQWCFLVLNIMSLDHFITGIWSKNSKRHMTLMTIVNFLPSWKNLSRHWLRVAISSLLCR